MGHASESRLVIGRRSGCWTERRGIRACAAACDQDSWGCLLPGLGKHVLTTHDCLHVGQGAEHTGVVLQTPISIFQRIQKDGASALKEILPKTKLWIPGNGGLQAYKQAGSLFTACQNLILPVCCFSCLSYWPFSRSSPLPLNLP